MIDCDAIVGPGWMGVLPGMLLGESITNFMVMIFDVGVGWNEEIVER